nr:MAG TPA: hypothetical protein [Bacteriophage sp.]DAV57725.1 MAG TPA: hypothetical protein [Caudoviricetes sp.]
MLFCVILCYSISNIVFSKCGRNVDLISVLTKYY